MAIKLRNETRQLKSKAISSMTVAMTAFNSPHDEGRVTAVLLHLQHAFEMLLKATLVQRHHEVFDKKTGRSYGFERCLHEAAVSSLVRLTTEEAGTLRAIDALRDDEQHWLTIIDEGLLYLHSRAGVTLFDDLLYRTFRERLADHIPLRILPIGSEPPQTFQTLIDREYENIAKLLKPHRRARAEASARVRSLLAMEAHVEPDSRSTSSDVHRVLTAVRAGKTRNQVFPRLSHVADDVQGEGVNVAVRFSKAGEGLLVHLVRTGDDESVDAAAIREVDLQKKYHWSATSLAKKLGLTTPRSKALRVHLGIDSDPDCCHEFKFSSSRFVAFSDNAHRRMRDALVGDCEMDRVWKTHGKVATRYDACGEVGCAVQATRKFDVT